MSSEINEIADSIEVLMFWRIANLLLDIAESLSHNRFASETIIFPMKIERDVERMSRSSMSEASWEFPSQTRHIPHISMVNIHSTTTFPIYAPEFDCHPGYLR
jgi:hypothetical protein